MKTLLLAVFSGLVLASSLAAKDLVYISEQQAVCYVPTQEALIAGHWECNLETDQCHCVADYIYEDS